MGSIYYPIDHHLTYVAIDKQEDHYELTVVTSHQDSFREDTSIFPKKMFAINREAVLDGIFRLIKPTYQEKAKEKSIKNRHSH